MGKLGAEVRNVSAAFHQIDGSSDLLIRMKDATKGGVSELELMRQAIIGIDLGATNDQLETFSQFARLESVRKGVGELETLQNIMGGVLRGSTELLDNFGISLTQLNERIGLLAEAGGKAAGKLSDVERRQLAVAAATDIMKERLAQVGDSPVTDAEKISVAAAAWENVKDQISEIASPTIASGLSKLSQWLSGAAESVSAMRSVGELEDLVEASRKAKSLQTPGGGGGIGGGGGDADAGPASPSRKTKPTKTTPAPNLITTNSGRTTKTTPAAKETDKSWTQGPDGWVSFEDKGLGWQDQGKSGQNNISRTFDVMPGGTSGGIRNAGSNELPLIGQMDDVESKFKVTFDKGEEFALGMTQAVGQAFEALGSEIGSELDTVWNSVFNGGKTVFDRLAATFLSTLTAAMVQLAAKWAAMKIMDMIIPGSGALLGGLFGRASGGPVAAGQPYIVGERGPEVFVPKHDGSILANQQPFVQDYIRAFDPVPSTAFGRASGGPVAAGQPYIVGERGREVFIPQTRSANQSLSFNDTINVDGFLPNEVISALKERRSLQREELLQLLTDLKKLNRLPA